MKIAIGSDHAGFDLKKHVMEKLITDGYEVEDKGCYSNDRVDYPDFGFAVGKAVANKECEFGVVICSTGIGISMAANKVPGVRAALCHDLYSAQMTRRHNDANVIAFGANITGVGLVDVMLDAFLSENFEGGRHIARVNKLNNYNNESIKGECNE